MHKKLENIIRKILHALECIIAVLTLLVLRHAGMYTLTFMPIG